MNNDFAVIATGGKQYRVSVGSLVEIEKLTTPEGGVVSFNEVLLRRKGDAVEIGTPTIVGATVSALVVSHDRDDKKIIFKYHSKTRHHRTKGHRQHHTNVKITAI